MSLTKIIEDTIPRIQDCVNLIKQENDLGDSLRNTKEEQKKEEIRERWDKVTDDRHIEIERVEMEIADSISSNYPFIKLESIDLSPDEDHSRGKIELKFDVGGKNLGTLFTELYSKAYDMQERFPDLDYGASFNQDATNFLTNQYMKPNVFNKQGGLRLKRQGMEFEDKPSLIRTEQEWDLEANINPKENEMNIYMGSYGGKNVWEKETKRLLEKLDGRAEIDFSSSDLEIKRNILDYITDKIEFAGMLKVKGKIGLSSLTKKLMKSLGIDTDEERKPWVEYEGKVSLPELEKIEKKLGENIYEHIHNVTVPLNIENEEESTAILRKVTNYLINLVPPKTNSEESRITIEQAKEFLQYDLENMNRLADEVPLNSYFVRQRTSNSIISGNEHEKLHIQLLERLERLALIDVKKLFDHNPPAYDFNEFTNPSLPDKYSPNSLENLLQTIDSPDLKQKIQEKLNERKTEQIPEGYLTIHEVYQIPIEKIRQLQKENPDGLIKTYRELYRNTPSRPLNVTGSIDEKGNFQSPWNLVFNGGISNFSFELDSEEYSKKQKLEMVYYKNQENPSSKLELTINYNNPKLLPLQEYALETLNINK